MFGFERLAELIRLHAPRGGAALVETVLAEMEHFSRLREDDITLLVVDQRSEAVAQVASASAILSGPGDGQPRTAPPLQWKTLPVL